MTVRYFTDTPISDQPAVTLSGAEAHHLIHVMRGQVGSEVIVFDGQGDEYRARIARTNRRQAELEIVERIRADREHPLSMVVAAALPKGDRQKTLIEHLVPLGVRQLIPLSTERSVAKLPASAHQRLCRAVIEASKQCGRNRLMQIAPIAEWSAFCERPPTGSTRWLAHPAADPVHVAMMESITGDIQSQDEVVMAIGPEGGWTEVEVETARDAGWRLVSLGPRVLRIETAAVALAALWSTHVPSNASECNEIQSSQ